jgi:hypothetical protein
MAKAETQAMADRSLTKLSNVQSGMHIATQHHCGIVDVTVE